MENTIKLLRKLRAFGRATAANVAMMFGLSLVPLALATGAGLDFAHAMMVRENIADALDAAALAVGAAPNTANAQAYAQQVFDANYTADKAANGAGQMANPQVAAPMITNGTVSLTLQQPFQVKTGLLGVIGKTNLPVQVSTTVKWGQTKLWVALVLDNTGSMSQTDSTGTSKISALQTASHNLLTTLKGAATNEGDVKVTITPFAKLVRIGSASVNQNWIDWTDWALQPVNYSGTSDALGASGFYGPGDKCPWTTGTDGFSCDTQPEGSSTATIPSSGTYKGYICPGVMQTYDAATGSGGHHHEGCYVATKVTGTTVNVATGSSASCSGFVNSCTCTGSGSSKVCKAQKWTYAWTVNAHALWTGCIMDRNKKNDNGATGDFDTQNDSPAAASGSLFPAANDDSCPATQVLPLPLNWTSAQWTTLGTTIDAMTPNGSTDQTIGLVQGWQTISNSTPYSPGALPANTTQYMILVSDGLNTQDRWYGDGSNQAAQVDARMAIACTNAKAAGVIIYTVFVDLGGTQGNSTVLQNCASDSTKYYDLTSSNAIVSTFNQIGVQITNLRVSG